MRSETKAVRYKNKLMSELTNAELEEFGQKMLQQALDAKKGIVALHPKFMKVAEAGVAEETRRSENLRPQSTVTNYQFNFACD